MSFHLGLNDELNLKGFISQITAFVKASEGIRGPQTASDFLTVLFSGINEEDVTDCPVLAVQHARRSSYSPPQVSAMQKALSGNYPLEKFELFSALVHAGAYDNLFRKNLYPLLREIEQSDPESQFICSLQNLIEPRFFSCDNLAAIRRAINESDSESFIIELVRHCFVTMENIPAYYAQRVYEQALTFDYDSPVRYALIREAADNGFDRACLEYANYLAKDRGEPLSKPYEERLSRMEEALHYFLLASNYAPALWNIGFILQNNDIDSRIVKQINIVLRLNKKLEALDPELRKKELDIISPANRDTVHLAYRIFFYLAFRTDSFPKSLSSLANMLESGKVILDMTAAGYTKEHLVEKYRRMAASQQDLASITNLGSRWLKDLLSGGVSPEEEPEEFATNMRMLEITAGVGMTRGKYNLAVARQYMLSRFSSGDSSYSSLDPAQTAEVVNLLQEAIEANKDCSQLAGELYYRLGLIESLNEDIREQRFSEAARLGYPDAIYEVCLRRYLRDRSDLVALSAIYTDLSNTVTSMNDRKLDATLLIRQIQLILQEKQIF